MLIQDELSRFTASSPTVCTLGVFDGVHLGHQALLTIARDKAAAIGGVAVAVLINPHPRTVLAPGSTVPLLTSLAERIELLHVLGVTPVPITFTKELSLLTAREFVALLREHLHLQTLVGGPDFALGHNREGTMPVLESLGSELGFSVDVIFPVQNDAVPVSSTAIREAIAHGDVQSAARQLGRPYSITGVVQKGEARGRTLGYPTANLQPEPDRALPNDGIYATRVRIGDTFHPSATYVGTSPTFDGQQRLIEVFLIDFNGDLYGQELQVEWVRKIRDDQRFESEGALQGQMAEDIAQARLVLSEA